MSLFKKKSQEEKTLEEIKKKKEQIDKLKEEIVKMGKLVLKDGKLTKVEDVPKENKKIELDGNIPDLPDLNVGHALQQERMQKQQTMASLLNVGQPRQVSPPPMSQEEYAQLVKQQQMKQYEESICENNKK